MDKLKKPFISLCLSFMLCVFALVASFSFAWFSNRKTVSAVGMQINAASPDVHAVSVKCYPVTDIQTVNGEKTYSFVNAQADTLPKYDPEGIEYQEYKRAIIIEISATISGDSDYELIAGTDNALDDIYSTLNYMSNVAHFRMCNVMSSQPGGGLTAIAFGPDYYFTYIENDTVKKYDSITICDLTEGTNTVYLVMEYNEAIINNIFQMRFLEGEYNIVEYQNDIWLLINPKEGEN